MWRQAETRDWKQTVDRSSEKMAAEMAVIN